jgi:hypothetical protein
MCTFPGLLFCTFWHLRTCHLSSPSSPAAGHPPIFDFVFRVVSNFGTGISLGCSPQTLCNLFTDFLKHSAPSQCWGRESATGLSQSLTPDGAVPCQ